ncbi:transporter substrate-binding domain-containing protein [Thalassoporum mexicanum]|uniref:transporter substrate-binding domain-containing protein n=1 Tax=Thalassoporum mexicanum TaxID=3457544 RepID=UPI0018DB06C1|nr:transporter substrate-binding domain-containing protein [Pseudanabaena sp. PCC 7367]
MSTSPIPTIVAQEQTGILERVKARGKLICGVDGDLVGFSEVDQDGNWQGFNVDFCKAIAAAVLGDGEAVEFKSLMVSERFTAIQNYDVDVLMHNTTWTLSRDTENEIIFSPPIFYDGQGIMVKVKSASEDNQPELDSEPETQDIQDPDESSDPVSNNNSTDPAAAPPNTPEPPDYPPADSITSLVDLDGMSICVLEGIGLAHLDAALRELEVEYLPLSANNAEQLFADYAADQCDAVSIETSQLAAWRSGQPLADRHKILSPVMSKEPFSIVTINSDDRWHDVVSWVIYATFYAEELGINQENYAIFTDTSDPEIAKFLGLTDALGITLGLAPDWTTQILASVGNYADIYERNLAPLGWPRGLNSSWQDGGLLYAMPFR